MSRDIVEETRHIREELIKAHGGIDGYFKHYQALDRARAARPKPRGRKKPGQTARKSAKGR